MSNEHRLTGWKKQKPAFTTVTADDRHGMQVVREFEPGLRGACLYADLGVVEATSDQFRAHIVKLDPEVKTERTAPGMHRHLYDFQFVYVLKGWTKFVIDGVEGEITFREGDSYLLPSRILHNEIRCSDDCQVLEIYGPANAGTEQLEDEIDQGRRLWDMTRIADEEQEIVQSRAD